MKNIKEYNLDELKQELISVGEKGYRAEQIFNWLYVEKVKSFDDMTNLSLELREKLKQNYKLFSVVLIRHNTANNLFDAFLGTLYERPICHFTLTFRSCSVYCFTSKRFKYC